MERVWTEKEPLVPEWYDHKEEKKEQADGTPKLSMKLLYGMIQELKQCSERLNARLDEFEHYMIEVQATRAQLEADAARTIARAKAAAARHDRVAFADAALSAHAHEHGQAFNVEIPPMSASPDTADAPSYELAETVADMASTPVPEEAISQMDEEVPAADEPAVAAAIAIVNDDIAPTASAEIVSFDSAEVEEPAMHSQAQTDNDVLVFDIDAIPLHAKPSKLESQPSYLMSLAQEVMGFTSSETEAEDGLDPGEGANPFDPDSFAAVSLASAEAEAAPAAALPAAVQPSTSAAMSSPFFTPRSQRHPSSKKTFLSLFGFRTRIS
ncbi:hypothetical protein PCCS19_28930 [Paenibacillus sp. CCS19]|uniref:hypothetical protein n=1 Tax=Paenibacillus sp. CCS19 TaxID=3158387 RepID=UPI00255D7572|nr:hypothetical protein [Paenibacillus cellulosilyticus]GMK39838.1 hypothetical protein PCCS19_28930 [Paenibacillus cellulosilyticus]